MQRGAPVETVIPWMHTQFKKYENEEVDQDNFIKIMMESKQFNNQMDAQHFFELLDIDKNGNVSFSEFFAPLISQLNTDQVKNLTAESAFTIQDITQIRQMFKESLAASQTGFVDIYQFGQRFQNVGGSLKRAHQELMLLWPEGTGMVQEWSEEEFSRLMSIVEVIMIKKYCLRNYLDSYKEKVNDFIVTTDPEKMADENKAKKALKFMNNQSDQDFIGRVKAFKDLEFMNIKNPEYVLSLIAEELYHSKMKGSNEEGNDNEIEGIKSIMRASNYISRKIQNMQVRINLLENSLNQKLGMEEIQQQENYDQIEGTNHALEILKALIERSHTHFQNNGKGMGFMMSYQDFLALNYLQVNHKVLQEEYNIFQKRIKEFDENKAKYTKAQKKWISKIQVVAGDAEEELLETKQDNELLITDNEQMQTEINKLMLENEVLKNQLNMSDLSLDYDRLQFVITESQKEIETNAEHQIMQEELQKLVQPTVKQNVRKIEKKIKKIEHEKAMKQVSISIQQMQENTPTVFEVIYQQKVHSAAQFENVQYNISDILQFVSTNQPQDNVVDQVTQQKLSAHVNFPNGISMAIQGGQDFLIIDNQTKYTVNMFLTRSKNNDQVYQIIIQSQTNQAIMDIIDLRSIESFVLDENNADVFAIKLMNHKSDLVMQSVKRTEILFNLISIFENLQMDKFKLYVSKTISIKQYLDGAQAGVRSYNKQHQRFEIQSPASIPSNDPNQIQEAGSPGVEQFTGNLEFEENEAGGITDQEMLDQLTSQRAGTFAVQKDELRERIVTTLNTYNEVRELASQKDPNYVSSVIHNPFVQALKVGYIQKKSDGRFNKWEDRFLCLTNICLLYFKKGEEQPRKFKILNNFILINVTEAEEKKLGRQNIIKIVFNKKLIAKDNYIACKNQEDKKQWMDAFKEFQINALEKRISLFQEKINGA